MLVQQNQNIITKPLRQTFSKPSFKKVLVEDDNYGKKKIYTTADVEKKLEQLGLNPFQFKRKVYNPTEFFKAISNIEESFRIEGEEENEWAKQLYHLDISDTRSFSRENLEKFRNLDVSNFKDTDKFKSKTLLALKYKDIKEVKKLLKLTKPVQEHCSISDLLSMSCAVHNFYLSLEKNKAPKVTLKEYNKIAKITQSLNIPYKIIQKFDGSGKFKKYDYRVKEILKKNHPELFDEKFYTINELYDYTKKIAGKEHAEKIKNLKDISPTEIIKTMQVLDGFFRPNGIEPSKWLDIIGKTDDYTLFTKQNLNRLFKEDLKKDTKSTDISKKLELLSIFELPELASKIAVLDNQYPDVIDIQELSKKRPSEEYMYLLQLLEQGTDKKNISAEKFTKLADFYNQNIKQAYRIVQEEGLVYVQPNMRNVINEILFGKETKEKQQALKQFTKETGVTLYMDNNLPVENIEYLKEFVNITKAKGDKLPGYIHITNLMKEEDGGMYLSHQMYSKPIVNIDGSINEEQLKVLFHENAHYKDCTKSKNSVKISEGLKNHFEKSKNLISKYISQYAATEPGEFIAEFNEIVDIGKIQKYEKDYESYFRYVTNYELSKDEYDEIKDELKQLISLYYLLEGPKIHSSPLAAANETKNDYDFVDISEKEIFI